MKFPEDINGDVDCIAYSPEEHTLMIIEVKLSNTSPKKEAGKHRWVTDKIEKSVKGQNDEFIEEFSISIDDYFEFLKKNIVLNSETEVVKEDNGLVTGSYIMVDPAGRFFDNSKFRHRYSNPILSVEVEQALAEIEFDMERFLERGGLYEWGTSVVPDDGLIRFPI